MSKTLACLVLVVAVAVGGCATGPGGVPEPIVFQNPPPPMVPPTALAVPKPFIYPNRGQTAKQEEFDRGQCYSWAVQQSGFDPANPRVAAAAPPPAPGAPQGGLFRGAAGGAALGAVGGAIGGNAGRGAAIGAAVGGLFGMMRRAEWVDQEQQQQASYQAQQQWSLNQGEGNYHRAFAACMSGRGYTIS
ncbi:MAG TPA: glycine zipper domain-containing protein [Patescibacteria group bacterium]|jgi:Glycine zipper|nr:glycine zipper domain-containing protein [Patescibacteria group bacterium]